MTRWSQLDILISWRPGFHYHLTCTYQNGGALLLQLPNIKWWTFWHLDFHQDSKVSSPPRSYLNHQSAREHPSDVASYICMERRHGAMLGPFDNPPFVPWCHTSPLPIPPKKASCTRRIILDLSWTLPPAASINGCTPKHTYMYLGIPKQMRHCPGIRAAAPVYICLVTIHCNYTMCVIICVIIYLHFICMYMAVAYMPFIYCLFPNVICQSLFSCMLPRHGCHLYVPVMIMCYLWYNCAWIDLVSFWLPSCHLSIPVLHVICFTPVLSHIYLVYFYYNFSMCILCFTWAHHMWFL